MRGLISFINQILEKNNAVISVFAGSRKSELEVLTPIILDFIQLMNKKYNDFTFVFNQIFLKTLNNICS